MTESESEAILRVSKKYHSNNFRNISFLLRGSTEPTSWSTVREMYVDLSFSSYIPLFGYDCFVETDGHCSVLTVEAWIVSDSWLLSSSLDGPKIGSYVSDISKWGL